MLPSWKSLAAAAAKTTPLQPAQGLPLVILLFLLAGLGYKSCTKKKMNQVCSQPCLSKI